MVSPFDTTISRVEARRVYNTLGTKLDRSARYEARARRYALDALDQMRQKSDDARWERPHSGSVAVLAAA